MFLNTPFNMGILTRFLTDWSGPTGRVQRLKLRMSENICVGDDMSIDGKVTRKYVEEDEHRVDVAITVSTQDGPAVPGVGHDALADQGLMSSLPGSCAIVGVGNTVLHEWHGQVDDRAAPRGVAPSARRRRPAGFRRRRDHAE